MYLIDASTLNVLMHVYWTSNLQMSRYSETITSGLPVDTEWPLTEELVETIAKALMDKPEQMGKQTTRVELYVGPADIGRIVGRQARTIQSMRTSLSGAGMRMKKQAISEMLA